MKKLDIEHKHIDIDSEKLDRIVNCALEEFSKNDYEKASTNNIVKNAGVSRGLLYHYFKDKAELFNFVVKYVVKITFEELEKDMDWEETDLFKRIRQSLQIKSKVFEKYPYMKDFYLSNNNKEILNEVKIQSTELYEIFTDKFYSQNLDFDKFKDGIDIDKAINTIVITLKGISAPLLNKKMDMATVLKQYDEYEAFFKEIFYK